MLQLCSSSKLRVETDTLDDVVDCRPQHTVDQATVTHIHGLLVVGPGVDPFIRANSNNSILYADLKCELLSRLIANGNSDYYAKLMPGDYEEFCISVENMLVRYQWSRPDDMSYDGPLAAEKFAAGEAAMYWGMLSTMIQTLIINPTF